MKSLNIKLNLNGSISVKEVDSLFLNENNACEVSIDYSSVVKEGWNIAVDLQPQYEQATEINSTTPGFISDENNVFMFLLSENYTKRNELRIQPKQVKSNGVVMDKIKYDFYTKKFKQSINATESEGAVSQSIADQILASEQVRDTNENTRNQNEGTRINSENSRIEAEELRATNELSRQENEEARNVFESYNDSKQYVVGNKVSFNGSSYVCYITPPSNSILPTNEAYWLLAAQKGSDGYTPVKGTDYFDGDDGLSAYQVWLAAGNVGTEAQFLAKLKGNQWRGAYVPGTPYVVDDVVSYNGSSYICILASLGNLPSNTTYWSLFAQAGEVSLAQFNAGLALKSQVTNNEPLTKNIFDKTKIIYGQEVYSDGSFKIETNSARTEYIPIPQNLGDLYVSGMAVYTTGLNRYLWFYDVNYTALGTIKTIDKNQTKKYFQIPSNAKYVAFSIYQRKTSSEVIDINTIQVELGKNQTDYVAYEVGIDKIDNKRLIANKVQLKTKGKMMLIFGDSITETATVSDDGATYTEDTRSNWPTFSKYNLELAGIWNYAKTGSTYKDRTVNGSTVLFRQLISNQITTAINNNRQGDIIVIAAGTNDGTDGVIGDYATAMGKATLNDLDRTKLYEAIRWAFWKIRENYPNAICFVSIPIQRADREQPEILIEAITKMAKRYNFVIIDALNESGIIREFEVISANGRYLEDGLHPNINGQKILSNLINRVILNSMQGS